MIPHTILCCTLLLLGEAASPAIEHADATKNEAATQTASPEAAETEPIHVDSHAPKSTPPRSRAFGARLETDPPAYAKPLSIHAVRYGIEEWRSLGWLDFGLEHRTRFEHRDDYYRLGEPENRDDQFLLRTRMYLGLHDIADPLRFGFEFQDVRQFMSDFGETNRDVDTNDILQAFVELYFADALGADQPIRLQAGRISFDCVDRKLIGRNRFRNAVNAFDGFRVRLGQQSSDWQLDLFALMPVERRTRQRNRSDEERWLYGVVGAWRKWSGVVTLEPYYLVLDEDRNDASAADREIHTIGLHAFGPIATTRFDYDLDAAFQFGENGEQNHRAFAAYGELGYQLEHAWKPRLSVSATYASGDRDANDETSERFDRLFAPNHFRSSSDIFTWQNVISPKLRIELKPLDRLRIDGAYGAYWLASDADAWVVANRRDPQGRSGDFVGQELELRVRYKLHDNAEMEVGYSHFMPGAFVQNTGPADDSDFFYTALTLKF